MTTDKLLHLASGFAASLFGAAFWYFASPIPDRYWMAGLLAAIVAGLTKEAADWMDNRIRPGSHGVEFLDLAATVAGALPVVILSKFF